MPRSAAGDSSVPANWEEALKEHARQNERRHIQMMKLAKEGAEREAKLIAMAEKYTEAMSTLPVARKLADPSGDEDSGDDETDEWRAAVLVG